MENYTDIEIDLDDQTFIVLATRAHEENITFNELCNNILREHLELEKAKKKKKKKRNIENERK